MFPFQIPSTLIPPVLLLHKGALQRRVHVRILRERGARAVGPIRLHEVRGARGVARRRTVPLAVGQAAHRAHHRMAQVVHDTRTD